MTPTWVVELTPPGRAAVAVVLVAGPDALRAVSNCFIPRTPRLVEDIPIGRIALGRWGSETGEELILCRRDAERIEIHCHGGAAAIAAVIGRLVKEGCQTISWQDWLERSSPNRVRAAAHIALAVSITERTAGILLDQFNGALESAIRDVIRATIGADWPAAAKQIDELLRHKQLGLHLTKPWRAVVFGPPNVGKSSLINALAGYERAIVSPIPGTTRDVVSMTTALDGWPVHLSDTAGLRETEDELESAGIALATHALTKADLAICAHDSAHLSPMTTASASGVRTIHVLNKIDLIPPVERDELLNRLVASPSSADSPLMVSALTGEGIQDLISAISNALIPDPPTAGAAVPFTVEQVRALFAARQAIDEHDSTTATDLLHALLR
jgi:tRNA modification GTPase